MSNLEEKYKGLDTSTLTVELQESCINNEIDTVKYLLNSTKLFESKYESSIYMFPFYKACKNGSLDVVKYMAPLILKNLDQPEILLNNGVSAASAGGKLDVVKYLLEPQNLKFTIDIISYGEYALFLASENGHVEVMDYLLFSEDLEKNVTTNSEEENPFYGACLAGKLNVVEYLLSLSDDVNQISYHKVKKGLNKAFRSGKINIVKYLLEEKLHKKELNLELLAGFEEAVYRGHLDLIHYCLFDLKLNITENIKEFLEEKPNKQIAIWFKTKELYDELSHNETQPKKLKL